MVSHSMANFDWFEERQRTSFIHVLLLLSLATHPTKPLSIMMVAMMMIMIPLSIHVDYMDIVTDNLAIYFLHPHTLYVLSRNKQSPVMGRYQNVTTTTIWITEERIGSGRYLCVLVIWDSVVSSPVCRSCGGPEIESMQGTTTTMGVRSQDLDLAVVSLPSINRKCLPGRISK